MKSRDLKHYAMMRLRGDQLRWLTSLVPILRMTDFAAVLTLISLALLGLTWTAVYVASLSILVVNSLWDLTTAWAYLSVARHRQRHERQWPEERFIYISIPSSKRQRWLHRFMEVGAIDFYGGTTPGELVENINRSGEVVATLIDNRLIHLRSVDGKGGEALMPLPR